MLKTNCKYKWVKIGVIVVILLLAAVGGFLGGRKIYDTGFGEGQKQARADSMEQMNALGAAVREKTELSDKLSNLMEGINTEVDAEGIAAYISNLESIITEINNAAVKQVLEDYKLKWQDFEQAYNTKDNAKISTSFAELKNAAQDSATKIQEILNAQIKDKAEALNNQ